MSRQKSVGWNRLDNAAKIFPPTSSKRDTKVFRFACELFEPVDPVFLQNALDQTMEAFPVYQSILKRGLFWYYLENCDIMPMVKPEHNPPCTALYDKNSKSLLFEVTYYKNRINFEVFHALADGTGALQFLRCLVYHYILLCHAADFQGEVPALDFDASMAQRADDSFLRYYTKNRKLKKVKKPVAYKIRGQKVQESRIRVVEGTVSVQSVLKEAHKYHTTLTVFLTAIFMCAICREMAEWEKRRPVVLNVPVNLRQYFSSETTRNFFGIINADYDFKRDSGTFEDVVAYLSGCFERELTPERLRARLNELAALEHNIFARAVPRVVKDLVLKIAYDYSARESTATLSNVGKVKMPAELVQYIRLFDVFSSTSKMQLCMCSFGDYLKITFTTPFLSTDIEKNFFRTLTEMGIAVELASNRMDDE